MRKLCILVLLFLPGCLVKQPGTKYQREIPVGTYVAGGIGVISGATLGGWSVIHYKEYTDGSTDVEFKLHNKAALITGSTLLVVGIATLVGSAIYQSVHWPHEAFNEGPSPVYLPMLPPRFRIGMYVIEKRSMSEVYICDYEQDYQYVYGDPGHYKPITHYNICTSAGISAECWWVTEEDLRGKRE